MNKDVDVLALTHARSVMVRESDASIFAVDYIGTHEPLASLYASLRYLPGLGKIEVIMFF